MDIGAACSRDVSIRAVRFNSNPSFKLVSGAQRSSLGLFPRGSRQLLLGPRCSTSGREHSRLGMHPAFQRARYTLNRLYHKALPGPARFLPTFLLPLSTMLAALGATYGNHIWEWLLDEVNSLAAEFAFLQVLTQTLDYRIGQTTLSELVGCVAPVVLSLSGAIFAFIIMPVLDIILGDEDCQGLGGQREHVKYRAVLHTYALLHLLLLGGSCWLVGHHEVPPLSFLGLVLSLGPEGGLVFTASHELLHSRERGERLLANALLCSMLYMHWSYSHLAHHNKVATPEDPASARFNEPLYAFLVRSVVGNLKDGVGMELQRLQASGTPVWSSNKLLWWLGCPLLLGAVVLLSCGVAGLELFVGQAVAGIVMLETVNYIEHYGLQRNKLEGGRYEPVGPQHSWNANTLFTNSVIFRLQRHTDHHLHANKPFQLLEDMPDAPQLPWSYPIMMALAFFPPVFFAVMNPRVLTSRVAEGQQQPAALPCDLEA